MFSCHPIIPLIFSALELILLIQQSIVKRHFFKVKTFISVLILFLVVLTFVFYNDFEKAEYLKNIKIEYVNWALLGISVIIALLFFTTIDFSNSSIKFQNELTKSINSNKYYVVLDKKDKIRDVSDLFLNDLKLDFKEIYGKNFFDVIETKYRIETVNDETIDKDELKKYYSTYHEKALPNNKVKLDLGLTSYDDGTSIALYFMETCIFNETKYRGRILMGDKKTEENLIGMESNLAEANKELDLIRNRFITVLNKTSEGIYFGNLDDNYIWFNDVLVKKLCLNGNTLSFEDFYKMIHNEDIVMYQDKLAQSKDDYNLSYRFNTGSQYVYLRDSGKKILSNKSVELCGIIEILNDNSFAKTETMLDSLKDEAEMNARITMLNRANKIYQIVVMNIASVPEINKEFGRAIGNSFLSQYVSTIKDNFVTENQIYRIGGLDFVLILTDYRKMDILKNNLYNGEKLLHQHINYANKEFDCEIYMGISSVDDVVSHEGCLENAKQALSYALNPQFNSNFAYFKDINKWNK